MKLRNQDVEKLLNSLLKYLVKKEPLVTSTQADDARTEEAAEEDPDPSGMELTEPRRHRIVTSCSMIHNGND